MLYVRGFIIVFGPVCWILSKKLSEIGFDINLNVQFLENVRQDVTQICLKA